MQLDVVAERRGSVVQGGVDVTSDRVQERWEPAPLEVFARRLEMCGRHHIRRVMQLRRREREARADEFRLQPLDLDDLDRHGAALAERAVVGERRGLTARGQMLEGYVAQHEERTSAELADQMLHRRLEVVDEVCQVMDGAMEGVLSKGHDFSLWRAGELLGELDDQAVNELADGGALRVHRGARGQIRPPNSSERAVHRCIRGSCVGSAYMAGQP